MRKRSLLLISMLLAAITTALGVAPAQAAPARADGNSTTVIFIHGFGSTDCTSYWKTNLDYFATRWTGPRLTYGFDANDTNCSRYYNQSATKPKGTGTKNTSLKTIGLDLAKWIYTNYSSKGIKVDVVAHSMGGLAIRSALTEVQNKTAGYPAYLYVEDVVTLGTPHDGALWTPIGCVVENNAQCHEMTAGSDFLRGLKARPVSAMGTDWSLIGSDADEVVSGASALAMDAQHELRYTSDANLKHSDLKSSQTQGLPATYLTDGVQQPAFPRQNPVTMTADMVFHSSVM